MRVVINGESWGIYVNSQQVNKDFLEEWFKTREGARWEVPGSPRGRAGLEYLGDNVAAYRRIYEIKTHEDPEGVGGPDPSLRGPRMRRRPTSSRRRWRRCSTSTAC